MKASDQTHLTKSGLRALCNGGLSQTDHTHVCARCGFEWPCEEFTKKECESKGVFNAVKVNKEGPYCLMCLHIEMARRIAFLRGIKLSFIFQPLDLTDRANVVT